MDLGLTFDFLPILALAHSQSLWFSRWAKVPHGFEVEAFSFAYCLFQNSSCSAVGSQNEAFLWGPGTKSKRDSLQDDRAQMKVTARKTRQGKNHSDRDQEDTKVQLRKMLSL